MGGGGCWRGLWRSCGRERGRGRGRGLRGGWWLDEMLFFTPSPFIPFFPTFSFILLFSLSLIFFGLFFFHFIFLFPRCGCPFLLRIRKSAVYWAFSFDFVTWSVHTLSDVLHFFPLSLVGAFCVWQGCFFCSFFLFRQLASGTWSGSCTAALGYRI